MFWVSRKKLEDAEGKIERLEERIEDLKRSTVLQTDDLAKSFDRAAEKAIKHFRRSSIMHYATKLSMPCPECAQEAQLVIIEENEMDGSIIRNEQIVIECNTCQWSVNIANTQRGARFLLNLFNELDPMFLND